MGKQHLGLLLHLIALQNIEEKDELENIKVIDGGKVYFFPLMFRTNSKFQFFTKDQKYGQNRKAEFSKNDFNKITNTFKLKNCL